MNYTQSQSHGFIFEDKIKKIFYPKAASNFISEWDVLPDENKNGLPVSIKTSKSKIIYLSSGPKFFEINQKHEMMILQYNQNDDFKEPQSLTHIILDKKDLSNLRGELSYEVVKNFDNDLKEFAYGYHEEAREFAKERKLEIENKYSSLITLNPKIGNADNQRRLQCSINYNDLIQFAKIENIYLASNNVIQISNKYRIEKINSTKRIRHNE